MSKNKTIVDYVKLQVPAGKANPAPPIGTALGPRGINIMDFCKAFNAQTQKAEPGSPIPTVITVYSDRSFTFITKLPPVSFFLKKHAKIEKGSSEPGKGAVVGKITMAQVTEIAKVKMQDMNAFSLDSAVQSVAGSARSMGLQVID